MCVVNGEKHGKERPAFTLRCLDTYSPHVSNVVPKYDEFCTAGQNRLTLRSCAL